MNIHIQIPSTRSTTRGLTSPRRNLISTRPLSPSTRVKKIRKLPSFDTRSLLGNPNLEYVQPAYILEQKLQLSPQVEELRKEVAILRENYQLILSTLKDTQSDTNADSSQNDITDVMYDEMAQHELSKKLSHYQAECDELDRRISTYNSTLTEKTENDLNNYVTNQKSWKTLLENEVESAQKLVDEKNELLAMKITENYAETIDANQIKISHLTQLLNDLRKEEQLMLQMHQDVYKSEVFPPESIQEIQSYQRKLQMLQHTHARKLVDMTKLQKELQQEKVALFAVKQAREENEKRRRERIASQLIYKKRAEMLSESSRAVSEMKKNEEDQNLTTTKKKKNKHKHKHWHHHRKDEANENENKSQSGIVVDDGVEIVQKPKTFKTEVEKVNSLCIREGTE